MKKMPIYQGKTVVYHLFVGDTIVNFTGKEKRAIPDLVYHHNQTKIAFLCCFFTTFGNQFFRFCERFVVHIANRNDLNIVTAQHKVEVI